MNPTTTLFLVERIRSGEITLKDAIGEAVGYASLCWTDHFEEFDSEGASAVVHELFQAVAGAIDMAVDDAALGSLTGYDNWQVTELLLQQRSLGFEEEDE